MVQDRALWRQLESLSQDGLAICVTVTGAVQVREIHVGRNEERLQADRSPNLLFGFCGITSMRIESSEIDACLGAVGVIALALRKLCCRAFKGGALRRRKLAGRYTR